MKTIISQVKLVTGSNGGGIPPQQTFIPPGGHQPPMIIDPNQRPPLRRVDSRGGPVPMRHPVPNMQPQNIQQMPPNQIPMNRPLQPRPPQPGTQYIATRPPLNQPQRFPNQVPPQRFIPPENINQNIQDQRRLANSSSPEGYQRPQIRPVQQNPMQPNRPPNTTNQQRSFEQTYKKFESESYFHPEEPQREKPILSQIKNQSFSTSKNSDVSSPITEEKQFHVERPSSSLGSHLDPEKDIDTSISNGKRQEEIERPDSRSGYHKEQPLHPNMSKIEEDDDDAVVISTRPILNTRNSNDNLLLKNEYNELNKPKIPQEIKPNYNPQTFQPDLTKLPPQTPKFQPKPENNNPQQSYIYSNDNVTKIDTNPQENDYKSINYEELSSVKPISQKPTLVLNQTNKKPPTVPLEKNGPQ